jgi:hypothetical protein
LTRRLAIVGTVLFAVFAFANPWAAGPAWLHLPLLPSERFASIYQNYFGLSELRAGRLLNLAVGLPLGMVLLTRMPVLTQRFASIFVTLGQRSLGAFVLHTYGLLVLAHLPMPEGVVATTVVQTMFVLAIVLLLNPPAMPRERRRQPLLALSERLIERRAA